MGFGAQDSKKEGDIRRGYTKEYAAGRERVAGVASQQYDSLEGNPRTRNPAFALPRSPDMQ